MKTTVNFTKLNFDLAYVYWVFVFFFDQFVCLTTTVLLLYFLMLIEFANVY